MYSDKDYLEKLLNDSGKSKQAGIQHMTCVYTEISNKSAHIHSLIRILVYA